MSRTLDDDSDRVTEDLTVSRALLSRMIQEGRSFSGHERNCVYLGTDGKRFANVSAVSGLDFPDDARAVVPVDWDGDGDLDLWISNRSAPRLRFLRNDCPVEGKAVSILLEGTGPTTSRDAIGARVELVLGAGEGIRRVRTLRAGEGFLSQSSRWIHFGVDGAEGEAKALVRWPGGEREEFPGIRAGGRYRLEQESGQAVAEEGAEPAPAFEASPLVPDVLRGTARIPLITLLPVPGFLYHDFEGKSVEIPVGKGRPVLINLFGSWCVPCRKELGEMAKRRDELERKGFEIVALSVDGLGDPRADLQKARQLISDVGFPFATGVADADLLSTLQLMHDHLVPVTRPLPVPTTALIDAEGRLSVLYEGTVTVDDLLRDVDHSGRSLDERRLAAAGYPGRIIDHPSVRRVAIEGGLRTRFQMAATFRNLGVLRGAVVHYRRALDEDLPEALALLTRARLARALLDCGDVDEAETEAKRALETDPDLVEARHTLALVLEARGRFDGAKTAYLELMDLDPERAFLRYDLGNLCFRQGDHEEAIGWYRKALVLDPGSVDTHANLALALETLGRVEEAIEVCRAGLARSAEDVALRTRLGMLLVKGGLLEEGIVELEKAVELSPEFGAARRELQKARAARRSREAEPAGSGGRVPETPPGGP